MVSLAEGLLAAVSGSLAESLAALPDLAPTLEALVRGGRAAFPDLPVDDAAWTAYLARHLRAPEVEPQLAELRAPDVHLVLACLSGSASAHAKLDARLRGIVEQAVAGIRMGAVSHDDVLQSVRAKLLVADGREPKLVTYSGRGPLDGWLRVVLARAALSLMRGRDQSTASSDDSDILAGLAAADDPMLSTLRARCGPLLKRAIEDAAAALSSEDRTLLRLHVVDGLTIDDLAPIYRTHRATIARRLARTRNALFEGARARAMKSLDIGEPELASLMGLMMSRLDLTIGRILEAPPSPDEP